MASRIEIAPQPAEKKGVAERTTRGLRNIFIITGTLGLIGPLAGSALGGVVFVDSAVGGGVSEVGRRLAKSGK